MNIENVIELPAGEFDLEMTQKSGQTSQPPWHEVGGVQGAVNGQGKAMPGCG